MRKAQSGSATKDTHQADCSGDYGRHTTKALKDGACAKSNFNGLVTKGSVTLGIDSRQICLGVATKMWPRVTKQLRG